MDLIRPNVVGTVFYTGKTTGGTAIDADLVEGYVLCADPAEAYGDGFAANYTRPKTANLKAPKCIVLQVPSSVNETVSTGVRRGGKVKVAWVLDKPTGLGFYVEGTTDIAAGDLLGVTDGHFYLTKVSSLDGTCCATAGAAFTTNSTGRITKGSFKSVT